MDADVSPCSGAPVSAQLDHPPLIALLGHAHDALEAEFNRRLKTAGFTDLTLAQCRNVLRHLDSDSCNRASALAGRCGVSKQALSLQIGTLERSGYLRTDADPGDRRARVVLLTERGVRAQRATERILRELDADWRATWGDAGFAEVVDRLMQVIRSR